MRTGRYTFYLRSKPESSMTVQTVQPFGNEPLEFNDQRKMLQVLHNEGDWSSDLLTVKQYASCNGSDYAVFGLAADGTGLLSYKFRENDKDSPTLFSGELMPTKLGDRNVLKSMAYDNSIRQWTTRYWSVDGNHGILSAGDYGPDFVPPSGLKDAESDALLIFEAYLKQGMDPGRDDDRRIKDYKIQTIRMEQKDTSGNFVFMAVYDLLPASNRYILAGNSVQDQDGWVRGTVHFVSVVRNTGSYTITSMGTSP